MGCSTSTDAVEPAHTHRVHTPAESSSSAQSRTGCRTVPDMVPALPDTQVDDGETGDEPLFTLIAPQPTEEPVHLESNRNPLNTSCRGVPAYHARTEPRFPSPAAADRRCSGSVAAPQTPVSTDDVAEQTTSQPYDARGDGNPHAATTGAFQGEHQDAGHESLFNDSFILRDALAPRQDLSPTLNRSRGPVERQSVVVLRRRPSTSPSTTALSAPPSLHSTSSCVFFESTSLVGSLHPLAP